MAVPFLMNPAGAATSDPAHPAPSPKDVHIYPFKLGDFKITVISDGIRASDKPEETFGINQKPEAVADLLKTNFLPTNRYVNGFSPVLIDTGTDVVLFDTGMGEGGRANGMGKLLDGLALAGYTPDQVTLVVLTHLHGDHIGGLMEAGKPTFPTARYLTGQIEYDFWTDPARVGTPAEGNHKQVLTKVVPLKNKFAFIGNGAEVVPGIVSMLAAGHTPGHMVFHVASGGKKVVLTADTANHYVLSLQRPDWEVRFDMDKAMAAETRRKIFDAIALERVPFIGYHMPFPSIGYAEKSGEGYRFVPVTYQFEAE